MTRNEAMMEYVIPAIVRMWNDDTCDKILEALKQEPKTGHCVSDNGKPEYIDRNQIEWYKCNLENSPMCKQNNHDCGICDLARCYARQIRELPTVNLESEE